MGKLKNLKPALSTLPPRLGAPASDKRAQERARNDRPWRAWYGTKRWQELRLFVFNRDAYVSQRSGVLCVGKYPAPNSPAANHKRPHRGDPQLFWDPANVETVTKAEHDSIIQAEEQAIPMGKWD